VGTNTDRMLVGGKSMLLATGHRKRRGCTFTVFAGTSGGAEL